MKRILIFISFLFLLILITHENYGGIYAYYNKLNSYTDAQKKDLIEWVNKNCDTSHKTWESLLLDAKLECRVSTEADVNEDFYNLPGVNNILKISYQNQFSSTKRTIRILILFLLIFFIYLLEKQHLHAFIKEKSAKYIIFVYLLVIFISAYNSTFDKIIETTFFMSSIIFIILLIKFITTFLLKHMPALNRIIFIVIAISIVAFTQVALSRVVPHTLTRLSKYLIQNYKIDSFPAKVGIFLFDDSGKKHSNTLVNYAVQAGSLDLVKYFVEEKNVNPNLIGKNAMHYGTSLEFALKYKAYKISDYLILFTPEYNTKYKGHTKLITAAKSHNLDFLKKVIGTRIFNIGDVLASIKESIRYNDMQALNYLLNHFELSKKEARYLNLLAYAHSQYNPVAYRILENFFKVQNTIYCEDENYDCQEIMHSSIIQKDYHMLEYMVSRGMNLDSCDNLMYSAGRDNLEMFKFFISKGADRYCKGKFGKTIDDMLNREKKYSSKKIIEYLDSHP